MNYKPEIIKVKPATKQDWKNTATFIKDLPAQKEETQYCHNYIVVVPGIHTNRTHCGKTIKRKHPTIFNHPNILKGKCSQGHSLCPNCF